MRKSRRVLESTHHNHVGSAGILPGSCDAGDPNACGSGSVYGPMDTSGDTATAAHGICKPLAAGDTEGTCKCFDGWVGALCDILENAAAVKTIIIENANPEVKAEEFAILDPVSGKPTGRTLSNGLKGSFSVMPPAESMNGKPVYEQKNVTVCTSVSGGPCTRDTSL